MSHEIRAVTREELDAMLAEHERLNPERPVSDAVIESLARYYHAGIKPGRFLMAVLANDLFEAMAQADSYNRATIFQICQYVYNSLPRDCWGSPDHIRHHLAKFEPGDI